MELRVVREILEANEVIASQNKALFSELSLIHI